MNKDKEINDKKDSIPSILKEIKELKDKINSIEEKVDKNTKGREENMMSLSDAHWKLNNPGYY